MRISNIYNAEFISLQNILCSSLPTQGDRDGMYSTFCRILPGKNTMLHAHFEPELFYIIQGYGLMTIENEIEKVHAGDLIRIPSLSKHTLKNIGTGELMFVSVYSEDSEISALPTSTMITSAPPTPNGPLHLGHISGPYLISDILTRYLRLRSLSVKSVCGTDDHQNYVCEKAHALSISVEHFRSQMRSIIQKGFAHLHIEFDEFIEPYTNKTYQNNILDFVQRAIDANIIEKETVDFPYCMSCDKTLVDASIEGYCPYCKALSDGSCENCGMLAPPFDLQHSMCTYCKKLAHTKVMTVYTFDLNKYLPVIKNELQALHLLSAS